MIDLTVSVKMSRKENEFFAKRVIHFYKYQTNSNKTITVNHFENEGRRRTSIYRIIKRNEETGSDEYLSLSGRKCRVSTLRNCNRVKTLFENDPLTSVRTVSKKLGIPRSTVSDIKIKRWGIVARTQKKAPKYVKDQERRAKTGLRKIYKKTRERVLVIDDETYVIVDTKEQPGRKFVHSNKHEELPFNQKFKQITKFPKKYLVWQAIDENGNIS